MEVKLFANLRNICNGVSIEVMPEGNRVIDILNKLVEMFPEIADEIFTQENTLKPFVHIYVNGKNIIHSDYLQTVVKETDQIALFPPVAGGQMVSCELEFRGINCRHLGMYFEELGAKKTTNDFPIIYQGNGWCGEILSESELIFTPAFKVNCVFIRFTAADEKQLKTLIKKYRYKTTRVGG